ncbi:LytTR family DNA-binding domain-containing protein [Flavobacterium sp. B17]|uniref:LytR/AlgR family response regulator transcription factor n=1 Tax=Flavobacterium sp. B17 TaxID=95618 RepID=UPI0003497791|nr:response regulator [Flavobacterium sp. B17]
MNVLLVEDEHHTARLLQEVIESDRDFIVIKTLESISETVSYLSKYAQNIDLMFLDIHLSDGHSFEIFRHIDINIPVIFCTAYDEYALKAIRNNGIEYILKPFEDEEILNALHKFPATLPDVSKQNCPLKFREKSPKPKFIRKAFLRNRKTGQLWF